MHARKPNENTLTLPRSQKMAEWWERFWYCPAFLASSGACRCYHLSDGGREGSRSTELSLHHLICATLQSIDSDAPVYDTTSVPPKRRQLLPVWNPFYFWWYEEHPLPSIETPNLNLITNAELSIMNVVLWKARPGSLIELHQLR